MERETPLAYLKRELGPDFDALPVAERKALLTEAKVEMVARYAVPPVVVQSNLTPA